jgi:4-phosphopantoate--beta-alanine ligase
MTSAHVPPSHPRAASIRVRERLIGRYRSGVVACAGLIAHGRGEAFDYLLGEETTNPALKAMEAAAATLLTAKRPVISVNGNVAALVAKDVVRLSKAANTRIEVNLFYRSIERERAIRNLLTKAGAREVLGVARSASGRIPELGSERRHVDRYGILVADVVLVPLEDGDRTEALVKMGKKVIAVDLNPLSRTAQQASITIVDNITRAMPKLTEAVKDLKRKGPDECLEIVRVFDNKRNLGKSIQLINQRLAKLAQEGKSPILEDKKAGL